MRAWILVGWGNQPSQCYGSLIDSSILELGWVYSHWAVHLSIAGSNLVEADQQISDGTLTLVHVISFIIAQAHDTKIIQRGLMRQMNCDSPPYLLPFFSIPV